MQEEAFGLTPKTANETESQAYAPSDKDGKIKRVPFGVVHIDSVIPMGVKPMSPQIIALQGETGARKTTTALNFLTFQFISGRLPEGMLTVFETLESGMTIERIVMIMNCIISTQIMVWEYHTGPINDGSMLELLSRPLPDKGPDQLRGEIRSTVEQDGRSIERSDICMSPDFVEACYANIRTMSPRQIDALDRAQEITSQFHLKVFGGSEHTDTNERRRRITRTRRFEESLNRWTYLVNNHGLRQIFVDYLTLYQISGSDGNSHTLMKHTVDKMATWVQENSCTIWVLAQEGVGRRNQNANNITAASYGSYGGDILQGESNINFSVRYRKDIAPDWIIFPFSNKSRRGEYKPFAQMIDPVSGAFLGRSKYVSEVPELRRFNRSYQ